MTNTWYRVFVDDTLHAWDRADFRGIARFDAPGKERVVVVWGAVQPDGPYTYVREVFADCSADGDLRKMHNLGYDAVLDLEEGAISFQACCNVDDAPVPQGLFEGTMPPATREAIQTNFSSAQQLRREVP